MKLGLAAAEYSFSLTKSPGLTEKESRIKFSQNLVAHWRDPATSSMGAVKQAGLSS